MASDSLIVSAAFTVLAVKRRHGKQSYKVTVKHDAFRFFRRAFRTQTTKPGPILPLCILPPFQHLRGR